MLKQVHKAEPSMGEFFPGRWRSADCFRFTRHRTETEREDGQVLLTWPWAPRELTELTESRRNRSAEQNANLQPSRDTCFMAVSQSFPPLLSGFARGMFILFPSDPDPHYHGIISSSGSKSDFTESNRKSPQRNFSSRSLATFCNHFSVRASAQNSPSCPRGQGQSNEV